MPPEVNPDVMPTDSDTVTFVFNHFMVGAFTFIVRTNKMHFKLQNCFVVQCLLGLSIYIYILFYFLCLFVCLFILLFILLFIYSFIYSFIYY